MYQILKLSVKALLSIAIFMCVEVCSATSQEAKHVDSFLGVTFGLTEMECDKSLKLLNGKVIVKTTNETLYKKGVVVGSDTAYTVLLKFNKNKLYGFTITFKPDFQLYKKIRGMINDTYIDPISEKMLFNAPYKRGDGKEEEAIIKEKAEVWSIWRTSSIAPLDRTINMSIKRKERSNGEPFALMEVDFLVNKFAP